MRLNRVAQADAMGILLDNRIMSWPCPGGHLCRDVGTLCWPAYKPERQPKAVTRKQVAGWYLFFKCVQH